MKIRVEIDPCDNLKLSRMARRAGITKTEAVRIIAIHGIDAFLARVKKGNAQTPRSAKTVTTSNSAR